MKMPEPNVEIGVEFVSYAARTFRLVAASEDARQWIVTNVGRVAERLHPIHLSYYVPSIYDFHEVFDFAVNGYGKDGAQ
jgi:hypothetical protein